MSVTDECVVFWSIVEREIHTRVPCHLKNLLRWANENIFPFAFIRLCPIYLCDSFSSLAGYSTAFTVKEFNEDEMNKLQQFATTIPGVLDQYCGTNKIAKNSRQLAYTGMQQISKFFMVNGCYYFVLQTGRIKKFEAMDLRMIFRFSPLGQMVKIGSQQ